MEYLLKYRPKSINKWGETNHLSGVATAHRNSKSNAIYCRAGRGLFALSLYCLVLVAGIITSPLFTYAQTTAAITEMGDASKIAVPPSAEPRHEISEVSGFFQSYVDDINPTALAMQLSPLLLIIGAGLIALSGLVLMLQAKTLALSMLTTGIGCTVFGSIPGLLVPVFVLIKTIPVWLTLIVAFFMSLSVLGAFAAIFIGKAAAASMIGNLAAWVIQRILLLLILPFTALRRLFSGNDSI